MGRTATIFIVICMGIIAASIAAIMMFQFARPFGEAASLSLALLCTMVVVHLLIGRSRDRSAVGEAVDRLEDRLADLDEDMGNLEGRLTGVETTFPRKTRSEIDPLFAEVEVLGTLVKQMAEAMADLETRMDEQPALPPAQTAPQLSYREPQAFPPQQQPQRGLEHHRPRHDEATYGPGHGRGGSDYSEQPYRGGGAEPRQDFAADRSRYDNGVPHSEDRAGPRLQPQSPRDRGHRDPMADRSDDFGAPPVRAPEPSAPRKPAPDPAMRELIHSALNANRVELHLQPIVTLPQRQVRFYEAFTRLRDSQGELIEASVFLPEAIRSGLIARIDNLLLFRSVQVIRRLTSRNRNSALFCNISALSLVDDTFFPGFLEFVSNNRNFADVLIFEFRQTDVAEMGALELESLRALSDLGFHFSIDGITDMKMDFRTLAQQGFKYAKLHADYLIGRRDAHHGHIHPSDFGDLLHRYGMELIPNHVETESQVLELLDFDVSLAQGNLFSPPRPVRAEVLQGAPAPAPRRQRAAE